MTGTPSKVKPFLKWAGGKGQLLKEIGCYYPFNTGIVKKYAEPFVGGGAVLFDILSHYELEEMYISDVNIELINTYLVIQKNVDELIHLLSAYQEEYLPEGMQQRKEYYGKKRLRFNICKTEVERFLNIEKAALMIFLNRTCFNGLYRVNRKGMFNVPIGAYKNPMICDEENLRKVAQKLENVRIVWGDYKKAASFIDERTFVYFDPPYRPLTETANFTAYMETQFSDAQQIALANFVGEMNEKGAKILLSNSDPKNVDANDDFFDRIYAGYRIERVKASRMINCNSSGRGKIMELLISNF